MTELAGLPSFHGSLAAALGNAGCAAQVSPLLVPAGAALPTPPASERRAWEQLSSTFSVRELIDRASADLTQPWPTPLASAAARVHRDGNRDEWESVAFARQHRLSRAVIAAAVTLDNRWLDEVADGIQLLCEQSSWCWPAHDDAKAHNGSILADVTRPFVDLGAGEIVGQLAWTDHTLGEMLDLRYPGLRARIRHEATTRIFQPFTARRDWHWIGLDGDVHNWNPWIHGNVLAAGLRLLDGPDEAEERAVIVALCLEGIDRYLTSLPDDGAIDEGYSYWWNGACRALEALDLACHATGDALAAAFTLPAVRHTVAFPHRMHLARQWYVNLADAQARETAAQPWHSLYRAAVRVGDADAARFACLHRDAPLTEAAGLGRLLRGLADPDWHSAPQGSAPLPRDVWLPSVQVLIARENEGTATGLTVVAKGGTNAEHHNHNDVGSFIVASDGVPVIVDAGRPTYTAATFGPDRYDIWTMQSSWHNVPELRGVAQAPGAASAAKLLNVEHSPAASALTLDIAAAYPLPDLASLTRTVRLDRVAKRVTVTDSWTFSADAAGDDQGETSIRLVIAGHVTMVDGGALITPLDGARPVVIGWPAHLESRLVRRDLDDPVLSDVWGPSLHRIDLLPTHSDSLTITMEQVPLTREGAS